MTLPETCEFCGCSAAEPCWSYEDNWHCYLDGGICSMCIDDTVRGLEPSALDLADVVQVKAAYL